MYYSMNESFEVIYAQITRFARNICPELYEDVSQEVALKLWSKKETLPRRLRAAYLRKIVQNAACDLLRLELKRRSRISYFGSQELGYTICGDELEARLSIAEPADVWTEKNACYSSLSAALSLLNAEQREAILLKADGYTGAEIARKQAVPQSTVRTRLHYARKYLQKSLGEQSNV